MNHTECEDCKLRSGDCGHHFKMDGKTNYDIPSLSACDRYGNCEFFQKKDRPQGDLISRKDLKEALEVTQYNDIDDLTRTERLIDNAPTIVINCKDCDGYEAGYSAGLNDAERPQNKWIKIFENPFTNGYVCPFCGHKIQVTEQFLPQVTECESCGADMRGGAE